MADSGRDQEHLGIDTNVLVAYLDNEHPLHPGTSWLSRKSAAFCPTVIHEAYHTLVFKMKWDKQEASEVLTEVIADENNAFVNQTVRTTKVGLNMSVGHGLGGRDSLILATYLSAGLKNFLTYDKALLSLRVASYGKNSLRIRHP